MALSAPELELLMIVESAHVVRDMLVLFPDFPVPENGWRSSTVPVQVVTPAGIGQEYVLTLHLTHFHIRMPCPVHPDKAWRVVASFHHLAQDAVPQGSRVLAEAGTVRRLTGKTT